MLCLTRTILLAVCLTILSTPSFVAQEPAKDRRCKNQFVFPNADLDNFGLPLGGKLQRVETHEIDVEDNNPSDVVATTNFDSFGRVTDTFLSTSKIKVFGKEIYSYDQNNRLILTVSYNPDGSSVSEDVFTYDSAGNLKQKITRNSKSKVIIWNKEFSYPADSEFSEFFDKRHGYGFRYSKDDRCRILELTSFNADRTVTSKIVVTYDDEKNTMEESIFSPQGKLMNKKKAEFEFDKNGNWIKKTTYDLAVEDGKPVYRPVAIVQRKITYFESK